MTFQRGDEAGQVGAGRLDQRSSGKGGAVGSRQSPTVALSSPVGRKTQVCLLMGVELGMGAHDPERGSAHSRRVVSLRVGVHHRPGDPCANVSHFLAMW